MMLALALQEYLGTSLSKARAVVPAPSRIFLKKGAALLVIIGIALLSPRTGITADVPSGVAWLLSQQDQAGSWGANRPGLTSPRQTTAAVLETLALLGEKGSAYSSGLAWLKTQDIQITEEACWEISLLDGADSDLGPERDRLLLLNSGTGWPMGSENLPEPLDTALALKALNSSGGTDSAMTQTALSFLSSTQNTDGGWGFGLNGSNAFLTAEVLESLARFRGSFPVEACRDSALFFLRGQARSDGTIGDDLISTALAYRAAISAGEDVHTSFPATESCLAGLQLSDGSWEDDVYTTAVVLKALSLLRPNLVIGPTDIALSHPFPVDGEKVTAALAVRNEGPAVAAEVLVRLYDGNPGSGGVQIGPDLRIAQLAAFGQAPISVTWDTTNKAGAHELVAVLDELQEIAELKESDNSAGVQVAVATLPDLVVSAGDVTIVPSIITASDDATITATVRNQGQASAGGFGVELFLGQPLLGGISLGVLRIPFLAEGAQAVFAWHGSFPQGQHQMCLLVDGAQQVAEANESNNQAVTGMFVYPAAGNLADLSITSFVISPLVPRAGESLTISATVLNTGAANVPTADVAFRADAEAGWSTSLGMASVANLAPGASTVLVFSTSLAAESYTLIAQSDPGNAVAELNELNNSARLGVNILPAGTSLPDLAFDDADLKYTPPDPTTADVIVVQATLLNLGNAIATDPENVGVYVTLFEGNSALGGVPLQGTIVGPIEPEAGAPVVLAVSLPAGSHDLYLEASLSETSSVDEIDRTNNRLAFHLDVHPPLPNLTASMNDISRSPAIPQDGQPVTIAATVRNNSPIAAQNVHVLLREGLPEDGTVLLDSVIPQVAGRAWASVQTTVQLPVGDHPVSLEIDPENSVQEWSETDNTTSAQVKVYSLPDLAIAPEDFAVTPAQPVGGKKITLAADVHNTGESTAHSAQVAFYDGDPNQGGTALGEPFTAFRIFGGSQLHVEKSFFLSPGSHDLHVVLDPDNLIAEQTKSNNTAVLAIVVGQETDLNFAGGLTLSPAAPDAGTLVTIGARIRNAGTSVTDNVTVSFSDGFLDAGGSLLGSVIVPSLAGNEEAPIAIVATLSEGYHEIYATVDTQIATAESQGLRNSILLGVSVPTPAGDLVVKSGGLTSQPSSPVSGSAVILSAVIWNYGTVTRSAVDVAFYDEQAPDPVLLGLAHVSIAAGESVVALASTILAAGDHTVVAVIDPDHHESEALLSNNMIRKKLTVMDGGIAFYDDSGNGPSDAHRVQGSDQVLQQLAVTFKQSLRTVSVDPVAVKYTYAGLSPSAAYRLTVVMVEDPGGGREEKVSADGSLLVGSYSVPDDTPATFTVELPKDIYQDGTVTVSMEAGNSAGAIVSEIYLIRESGLKEMAISEGTAWLQERGNYWSDGANVGWVSTSAAESAALAFSAYRAAGRSNDLVCDVLRQKLCALQAPDYSWEADVNSTTKAVIALVEAGESPSGELVGNALLWLKRQVNPDGGWGSTKGMPSRAHYTGIALAALVISGESTTDPICTRAVQWLKATQLPSGYWSRYAGGADTADAVWTGPWPAIGLTLATSIQDPAAQRARTRYLSFSGDSGMFNSYWENYLRILTYCGGSTADRQWVANRLMSAQNVDGGWLLHPTFYLYPTYDFTAQVLESVAKAGVIGSGMDNGFAWLAGHTTSSGTATNLLTELSPDLSGRVVMASQQAGALGSNALLQRAAATLVSQQHYWKRGFWADGFFTDSGGCTTPSGHVIAALLATPYYSYNQPAIWSAGQFLIRAQSPDGGWPTYIGWSPSVVYDTGVILTALLKWGAGWITGGLDNPIYVRGMSWLLSNQGLDGGWGNTRDTSQAMLALVAEGRHPTALSRARAWLVSTQNRDGGWGSALGETSTVDATSQALIGLAAVNERGLSVAAGVSWLLAARNSDHGWGVIARGESSNANSTAFSVWALAVSQFNSGVELEVLFNKPWYYAADQVAMVINPLNKSVQELTISGTLQDQYGATAALMVTREGQTFASEYQVASDALPGVNTVNFLAVSDDSQGTKAATFVVRSAAGQLPDLAIALEDLSFDDPTPHLGDRITCTATIHNAGLIDAHNVTVRAYRGAEVHSDAQIGGDLFIDSVAGQGSAQVTFSLVAEASSRQILVVVDPDNGIAESRKDNNSAAQWLFINATTALSDLELASTDVVAQPAHPYLGETVAITSTVHNVGTASAAATIVRFYNGDPGAGGTQIGSDVQLPTLAPGAMGTVSTSLDTTGLVGRVYVYVVSDPDNSLVEISKTNNKSFAYLDLQQMPFPDLLVPAGGMVASPAVCLEGETVMVSVTVKNRGLATSNANVALYDGDPKAGGIQVGMKTLAGVIGQNESRALAFVWPTTGAGGTHVLYAVLDSANDIVETYEDNNTESVLVTVEPSRLELSVSAAPGAFGANAAVPISVTATSSATFEQTATLNVVIKDLSLANLATVVNLPVVLAGGASTQLSFTWNSGGTLAGSYAVSASLVLDGRSVAAATAGFSITIDSCLLASVVTDKTVYRSNETARITWGLTSASANYDFTNLTATLTIADSSGATLFTAQRVISSLVRGQHLVFDTHWGVLTRPPGAYPLSIRITDGAVLLAQTIGILSISADTDPKTLLAGAITASPLVIYSGDGESVTYSIRNVGNRDLPLVRLSIKVVSADQQTVHAELADTVFLTMGDQYSSAQSFLTLGFSAADYLTILVAEIDGVSATLAGEYFRIQGAPSAPSVNSPMTDSTVATFLPVLIVNNAADPNALDDLTYFFELYADGGLSQLVAAHGPIPAGEGTTGWQVPIALAENSDYWWRCRAFDGWSYGPWMATGSFFVNTVNDPPGVPSADQPLDGQDVDTLAPALVVRNALDPDEDQPTYNYRVATDAQMTNVVAQTVGVFETAGTTAWQVGTPLADNSWYWWTAQADDWLEEGPWMSPASFFVNTANDAPTAPVQISPADGAETGASVTLEVGNATDPDYDPLTYLFELDGDATFASGALVSSGPIAEGAGRTLWSVPQTLAENTRYYWRARAGDGAADGPCSAVGGFFVNEVNEPPTAPVPANPSDGGEVAFFQPELTVRNASDPDGDALVYDYEIYADATLATLVTAASGIAAGDAGQTSWTADVPLADNSSYWWRCRASDGELSGPWMAAVSFIVNTANDAPTAPQPLAPSQGASVDLVQPQLVVADAVDPDGDPITYEFEVFADAGLATLVVAAEGVPETAASTSWTVAPALQDNRQYWWRARAFDGERYGPWMPTSSFTVHLPVQSVNATIDFDPNTLNLGSRGTWVTVYVELPPGYDVRNILPATVKLNGVVPAEMKPVGYGDEDRDGIPDAMLKFSRSSVEAILAPGERVIVTVSGMAGAMAFEGIDIIRVTNP